jgi:hypothetical protein
MVCGFESLCSHQLKGRYMKKPTKSEAEQQAVKEWLKTNKPTICPPMQKSDPSKIKKTWGWGSKKKKK